MGGKAKLGDLLSAVAFGIADRTGQGTRRAEARRGGLGKGEGGGGWLGSWGKAGTRATYMLGTKGKKRAVDLKPCKEERKGAHGVGGKRRGTPAGRAQRHLWGEKKKDAGVWWRTTHGGASVKTVFDGKQRGRKKGGDGRRVGECGEKGVERVLAYVQKLQSKTRKEKERRMFSTGGIGEKSGRKGERDERASVSSLGENRGWLAESKKAQKKPKKGQKVRYMGCRSNQRTEKKHLVQRPQPNWNNVSGWSRAQEGGENKFIAGAATRGTHPGAGLQRKKPKVLGDEAADPGGGG